MGEYSVCLEPLPGHGSFVVGRYGIEPARAEGVLKLCVSKLVKARTNDTRVIIPGAVGNQQSKAGEQSLQVAILQGATVSFVGLMSSTQPNCDDTQLVNLECPISQEDLVKKETGSTDTSLGMWVWRINLLECPYILPPSRKVVHAGALKKGRKLLRISYNLNASATFLTNSNTIKLRCSVPIEPFVVWPSLRGSSMRNIFLQVLRPIGHRWSNILPTAQYDLSVSSIVFGPGDKFEWGFRIVPRGHTCSNLIFKLLERYELLDRRQLENPTVMSNNPIFERILINWDYRTMYGDDSKSPSVDLFNQNFREFTIPVNPPPNPTTTVLELCSSKDGTPIHPSTIPTDGLSYPKYGCLRHMIRIKITFNGAPSIRLECPVVLLSLSASKLREYYILSKPQSNHVYKLVTPLSGAPNETRLINHEAVPDSKARIREPLSQPASTASALTGADGGITQTLAAGTPKDNSLSLTTTPLYNTAKDGDSEFEKKHSLHNRTISLTTLEATSDCASFTNNPRKESDTTRYRHTWDHSLRPSQIPLQKIALTPPDTSLVNSRTEVDSQNLSGEIDLHNATKPNATSTNLGGDEVPTIERISAQISILKLENAKISKKIAKLESMLESYRITTDSSSPMSEQKPPEPKQIPTHNPLNSAKHSTMLGWKPPPNSNSITDKRLQAGSDDLFVESNPMPSLSTTYPEPINIKHTRPKFIRAKSNDHLIYPRIPGSSIIKSALGVFTASHSTSSSSLSKATTFGSSSKNEDKRK